MAYDEGLATLMRDDLANLAGVVEKKMFGGLCFMLDGHMLCGIHKGGAMYRVGKAASNSALAIDGTRPMDFTGRPMRGFVDVDAEAMADDVRRAQLLALARDFVAGLPAK